MLYNDAYRLIISQQHPASMGQRGVECWPNVDLVFVLAMGSL